jgi:rSAM/selenodomain-associated transferase 1
MLIDTVSRVRSLKIDTFIFYDGDAGFFQQQFPALQLIRQQGTSLGDRLQHAFATLCSLGYGPTVVIGTDAPDLPVSFLAQAFERISKDQDLVFGPAEDGGYYLVGLKAPCHSVFAEISWSTSQVLEQSLHRAQEAGLASSLLPAWYDVDSMDDLYRPGLLDPRSDAPLTREFISGLGVALPLAARAV